jgi:hypothetical protein
VSPEETAQQIILHLEREGFIRSMGIGIIQSGHLR